MAAAVAGRFGSLWRGKIIDGHQGSDSPSIADAESSDFLFYTWPRDSFQATVPWNPGPSSAGQWSWIVDHVNGIGPAASYGAQGTPDAGSTVAPQTTSALPSSFLVQFAAGATVEEKAAALASVGGQITQTVRAGDGQTGDLVLVEANGHAADAVVGALGNAPGVSFAEVNGQLRVQAVADDLYYSNGSQWGMYGDQTPSANVYGSQAGEAWWGGYTGASTIVVGDIDTGIDYTHRDLYLNVWLNQGELPKTMVLVDSDKDGLITFRDLNHGANYTAVTDLNLNGWIDAGDLLKDARWADGVDQNGNGYVDDLIGWDFVNNDNDPYDDNGHGTHTAGTIGAMGGNGTGVAGVNWNVEIMALKFLDKAGSGYTVSAVAALDYYTAVSAEDQAQGWTSEFIATNNSWGGGAYSTSLHDAIVRSARQDALFIAAAGNGGSDRKGDNNDLTANHPSGYSTLSDVGYEAVVAVAALTSTGELASYSNYGAQTVDLGAPGSGIWSTVPGGKYASYSGTSMATPHVAGALALYASLHPEYTAAQLHDALLSNTVATPSLANKTATGGRLDIGALIESTDTLDIPLPSGKTVYGAATGDAVVGADYADILSGVPANGANLGEGTIDLLYGKGGADTFVLGDARGLFYDDGNALDGGRNDYAIIADFMSGDKIQLASGNYLLLYTNVNGVGGTGIYRDTDGRYDGSDELIGILQQVSSTSLSSADFIWA